MIVERKCCSCLVRPHSRSTKEAVSILRLMCDAEAVEAAKTEPALFADKLKGDSQNAQA